MLRLAYRAASRVRLSAALLCVCVCVCNMVTAVAAHHLQKDLRALL
jgi:hypothetical protein